MKVKIDTFTPTRGNPTYSYTISDNNNVFLASGQGFISKDYLAQSIAIRKRALLGYRPAKVVPTQAEAYSMQIIERWNDAIYGATP